MGKSVVSRLSKRDRQLGRFLGREGYRNPFLTVAALRKADIKPQTAMALLRKESGGGKNIFGCDHGSHGDSPPYCNQAVTEARARKLFNSNFSNGVGPTQLTSKGFVKMARDKGGEWRPYINMVVGFSIVGRLIDEHGITNGAARYNGGDSTLGERNGARYGREFAQIRGEEADKLKRARFNV